MAGYLVQVAFAGAGQHDFLRKRPGLKHDVQLWNEFLKSENQPDSQGLADEDRLDSVIPEEAQEDPTEGSVLFLGATTQVHDLVHLQAALRSCLRKHAGYEGSVPVPHGTLAEVAAAAVASLKPATRGQEKLLKVQVEACLETSTAASESTPALQATHGPAKALPKVETALVTTNLNASGYTAPCAKDLKKCDKDIDRCKHVLDILQFLRMEHIAVEKTMQREAQARKGGLLLQTVLEKHGLSVPKPEDWDWTGGDKLLLQTALEQHGLALIDQDWPSHTPDLVHPIPVIPPTHNHEESHTKAVAKPSNARPLGFKAKSVRSEVYHIRCAPQVQKQLDTCASSLHICKTDVDNHNAILNSIADRASRDREAKLLNYYKILPD